MSRKSQWLNTKRIVNPDVEKPCLRLGYCPYGGLVEEYPFSTANDLAEMGIYNPRACHVLNGAITSFGHDCPVHYLAEFVPEKKR